MLPTNAPRIKSVRPRALLVTAIALSTACGGAATVAPDATDAADATASDIASEGAPQSDALQHDDMHAPALDVLAHDDVFTHDDASQHDDVVTHDDVITHGDVSLHDDVVTLDDALVHGDALAPGDAHGMTPDGGGPTADLLRPRAGEWPMFHRDLAHTGLADDLRGAITATSRCVRWERPVTGAGGRAAGGPVVARVAGVWTVFVATQGTCDPGGCTTDSPGSVYALRGSDGAVLWHTRLPAGSWADPYAPLLADVDADGRRELIVPSNSDNRVYALRTETEGADPPGSIQWTFTIDDPAASSETGPVAADLDPSDPALEIVIGTGTSGRAARFYAIDGATGLQDGRYLEIARRSAIDPSALCAGGDKADSSSPSIALIDGQLRVFGGAWDGRFYSLEYRTGPAAGLYAAWVHELPRATGFTDACSVRKVRSGSAVGQVVPGGDLEVAFGYMIERPSPLDYRSSQLRVLNARTGELVADVDVNVWKSTPALADFDPATPGLELAGGRYQGVYMARTTGTGGLATAWNPDLGDGNGGWGGNRSSPLAADIDGDGRLEVCLGLEGAVEPGFACFDGLTGAREWTLSLPAPGATGSPAAGDLDGDGALEIVFLAIDGRLRAIDSACP